MRKMILIVALCLACNPKPKSEEKSSKQNYLELSRSDYKNKLQGFWLGQCIANWTGLVTEMDKIGNIGEIKTGDFYTREDWGKKDEINIWGKDSFNNSLSETIDFVVENPDGIWGADDDTDIEYLYQQLLYENKTIFLTPEQIRDGWLKHIRAEEENYLWVSNQRAFNLMAAGVLPPETSLPKNNPDYEMIDAQLTTEIFGLFAPARPDIARKMAHLPIRVTANGEAEHISKFYVSMYSLATTKDATGDLEKEILQMADKASSVLPKESYAKKMYDFVKNLHKAKIPWEQTRDSIYQRYQVEQKDGYDITSRDLYCNGCFAAGINFAASLVSLFYGKGDIVETIKIGCLTGWDSDNPTATWGGMLGFMLGKDGVEKAFDQKFSNRFNIHRTRQNFPNDGIDNFEEMAKKGVEIINLVVATEMNGRIDTDKDVWLIPIE